MKAFDGAVVRVHEELRQRRQLRCPVPAVAAVDQDGISGLEVSHHVRRPVEKSSHMVQPSGILSSSGGLGLTRGGGGGQK